MNLTDDLKSTLNKTLEIALGIEKINSMINPQKAHTEGRNLVNAIYKDVQLLANQSRYHTRQVVLKQIKPLSGPPIARSEKIKLSLSLDFKKQFSDSIKSINNRVKMSKAGKRTIGQLLRDESLPFNQSFDKALSSRVHTPKPKSLPFVSITTGKTENSMTLPHFQEYLELKGSNYLKMKYNDELISRFDKATTKVQNFQDEFDLKASTFIKAIEDRPRRGTIFKHHLNPLDIDLNTQKIRKRSLNIQKVIFNINSPQTRRIQKKTNFSRTQPSLSLFVQGNNHTQLRQNEKFLDMINKIDIERPRILREKVRLIQNDNEKYKNNLHSLKKFKNFKMNVESKRRKQQNVSTRQGDLYMRIIEGFRIERYKPSQGELEILEFWKEMVEYGWVVTAADLEEVGRLIKKKGINTLKSDGLLKKLKLALTNT